MPKLVSKNVNWNLKISKMHLILRSHVGHNSQSLLEEVVRRIDKVKRQHIFFLFEEAVEEGSRSRYNNYLHYGKRKERKEGEKQTAAKEIMSNSRTGINRNQPEQNKQGNHFVH
mmetsp:Transcript_31631/g.35879  ORF Transcript_31631/g.35879 Transcript_31631/m.35879 type:complete len:114 (-) Transcript_31631:15-356(-)